MARYPSKSESQIESAQSTPAEQAPISQEERIKQLEAQLAAAKVDKEKAEDQAVSSVLSALGMTPADLDAASAAQEKLKNEPMREYNIGKIVVSINERIYTGRGVEKASVVEVILSLAGNKRMRELRAKIGNNHEIQMLATGGFSSRVIGQAEDSLE